MNFNTQRQGINYNKCGMKKDKTKKIIIKRVFLSTEHYYLIKISYKMWEDPKTSEAGLEIDTSKD